MATIDAIDTWIVDVPTIRPHVLSMTSISRQSMVIVRVRCADGVSGLGEGTTIGGLAYGDESPESIKLTIDTYFAPLLVGADSAMPAALMTRLRQNVVGNHFAKNAVETALLDCVARRAGVPLSDLLGGRQHDRLPVLWTLASGDTAKDIAEAEAMIAARRHNVFKLKIGKRPLADRRQHFRRVDRQPVVRMDAQALQARHGEKGCGCLAALQLVQPGLHIAAENDSLQVRPAMQNLGLAPQAGGSDNGP